MVKSGIEKEFVRLSKEKFGNRLRCVLLYGSRAKGKAKKRSDWDFFLVLSEKLPEDGKKKRRLEEYFIKERLERIFPTIAEKRELEGSPSPLIYGILVGYKVLYGADYWKKFLQKLRPWILEKRPVWYEGERKWELAKLIQEE